MIRLHTFPPAFGLRNVSPFCLKVEMALTYIDMEFEIVEMADPREAPKGKLPFVDIDGEVIADSELILCRLDEMSQGRLYSGLTPQQMGEGYAFTRLAEDHLYWLMVSSRWLEDGWFPNIVEGFFGFVPSLLRGFASSAARREVRKTLNLHGLGRHTREEQAGFLRRDLAAISDTVKDGRFIVGEDMTAFDFAIAALLAGLMDNKPETWVSQIASEYPELSAYAERVQEKTGVYGRVR
jgi:glutathione S-transferase